MESLAGSLKGGGDSGIKLYAGIVGYMDPHVNVGSTAIVPHERRTFQAPAVPYPVVTQVVFGVIGHVARIKATLCPQAGDHFVLVRLPIGFEECL